MSSLYVHIPFCVRKCLYCDFYSIEDRSMMSMFLRALDREMHAYASYSEPSGVETIFVGGGTPSLLAPEHLQGILGTLASQFTLRPDAEITVETNPGTVDAEKLSAYRSLGVNRLSIGVQSFCDRELQFLRRIHTREEALRCFALARQAGFGNISIDLIFSLPGQTLAQWKANLQQAIALAPDHLSVYSLIVEDRTPLARMVSEGRVLPCPTDLEAEFYEFTMSFLADHGFEQYEISNYAKPGYRSRHNASYWSHRNYLGFGPSAHSFWQEPGERSGRRWWNLANVHQYCEMLNDHRLPVASEETLGIDELVAERIFLGLRSDGVELERLHADLGFEFLRHQHEIVRELVDRGLAVLENHTLRLTSKGFLLCDEICERLLR